MVDTAIFPDERVAAMVVGLLSCDLRGTVRIEAWDLETEMGRLGLTRHTGKHHTDLQGVGGADKADYLTDILLLAAIL